MILNAYAVLDAFLLLVRLVLGLLVLVLGFSAWRRASSAPSGEAKVVLEDRSYLVFLLAVWLLVLNVVSWPLFYLLLQSYIPQWPGVMCIYGVTRIGTGSQGISGWLPSLVTTLEAAKPALVFASGAWFVLYGLNRRTATAPLTRRILLALLGVGLLSVGDSLVEAAYLVIPKKEKFPSSGCCTQSLGAADTSRLVPHALFDDKARPVLAAACYGLNLAMLLALGLATRRLRAGRTAPMAPLVALAVLTLLVSSLFLVEIAAPTMLGLAYHHCPYDLVSGAPESLLGVAMFLFGTFAVGWAGVAAVLANCDETRPLLACGQAQMLTCARYAYLGSLIMISVELALAYA